MEQDIETQPDFAPLFQRLDAEDRVRPWSWPDLDAEEAALAFALLGRFVDDFNTRYAWSPDQLIPPCWPAHGAIVEELTTLWWSRYASFDAPGAGAGRYFPFAFKTTCTRVVAPEGAPSLNSIVAAPRAPPKAPSKRPIPIAQDLMTAILSSSLPVTPDPGPLTLVTPVAPCQFAMPKNLRPGDQRPAVANHLAPPLARTPPRGPTSTPVSSR